jgi:sulfatase modifying factor 1
LAPHRSAWQPLLAYATGGPAGVMDLGGTFTFFTVRYANDQDIFDNATALRRALLARFSGREISILADGAGAILAHAVHQLHYPNHGIGRIIARGGAFHGTPLVQALHAGELAVPAELAFLALQAPGAVHLAWDGFDQNPLLSWTNSDLRSLNNRFPTNLANTYFAFTNSAIADSAALSEVDTRLQAVFGYATDGAVPQPSAHLQRYVAGAYQSRTTELGEATDVEIAAQLVPTVEGMAIVPGGSFQMGDALGDGLALETPVHEVPLSPFYMGESTVTNAEMRDVMQWALGQGKISATNTTVTNKNGTVQQLLDLDGTGSQLFLHNGTFIVVIGKNEHPCVAVTWYGAAAYANFRSEMEGRSPCFDFADWSCDFSKNGYRLPTEAQWEKAARGGLVGQRFPWGDIITHAEANYYSDETYDYDQSPTRGAHPSYGGATAPAAAFAANGYGLRQMAGNVAEWCYDRFSSSWYEKAGAVLLDPTGPDSGSNRVTRGGSADDEARKCRVAERSVFFSPNASFNLLGFRVVRPFE